MREGGQKGGRKTKEDLFFSGTPASKGTLLRPSLSSPSPWFRWSRPYFHLLTGRVLRCHKKKSPSHTDIQLKRQGKVDVFYVAQEQCHARATKNFLLKNLFQKHFIPQTKNNYRYTYTQKNPILHNPSPPSGMQIRENNVKNEREGDKRRFNCNKSVGRRRLIRHWPLGQRIFSSRLWEGGISPVPKHLMLDYHRLFYPTRGPEGVFSIGPLATFYGPSGTIFSSVHGNHLSPA